MQLKAEKEKADLKQAQMQKEMKDELERLRTQFVFKVYHKRIYSNLKLTIALSNKNWNLPFVGL